jgi:hypothetical protein
MESAALRQLDTFRLRHSQHACIRLNLRIRNVNRPCTRFARSSDVVGTAAQCACSRIALNALVASRACPHHPQCPSRLVLGLRLAVCDLHRYVGLVAGEKVMPNREDAREPLREYAQSESLRKHALAGGGLRSRLL